MGENFLIIATSTATSTAQLALIELWFNSQVKDLKSVWPSANGNLSFGTVNNAI